MSTPIIKGSSAVESTVKIPEASNDSNPVYGMGQKKNYQIKLLMVTAHVNPHY